VAEAEFPAGGTPADKLRFFLRYAVLAPSRHNTQPWRFEVRDNMVALYTDPSRAMPAMDPLDRELIISCGVALVYLRLTIRHFGYTMEVTTCPDPDQPGLLARVRLGHRGGVVEAEEELLFHAILQRRTNRRPFHDQPVPASLLQALEGAAAIHGAWLQVIREPRQRQAVIALIAEGNRIQAADPAFQQEIATWGRVPLAGQSPRPPSAEPVPGAPPEAPAPTLAILGTPADSPPYWLIAGEALGRVLLRAAADGVSASFLNQPIEVAVLRFRLMALLGHRGFPQLLLRLGYGPAAAPVPRRPIDDVLM
jgi:nitroreductase